MLSTAVVSRADPGMVSKAHEILAKEMSWASWLSCRVEGDRLLRVGCEVCSELATKKETGL